MKINPKIDETTKDAVVEVAVEVVGQIAEGKGPVQIAGFLIRRGAQALNNHIQASKEEQQEKE